MSPESDQTDKLSKGHEIAQQQSKIARLIVVLCCSIAFVCILIGGYLVNEGATGGFNIMLNLKGVEAYFASVAPGLLFLVGAVVIVWKGVTRKFRYVIPLEGDQLIKVEKDV